MTVAAPSPALWGGRFRSDPSPELTRLNHSLPVDHRLWREEIEVSRVWAEALGRAGVLTTDEAAAIRTGLGDVSARLELWSPADWLAADDEDIHTLVERLLGERVGGLAGKLATGRSRNDQVATVTRLWAVRAGAVLDRRLRDLESALVEQAEPHLETAMPSYTHLQRAQPVSAAHWLLSHFWPLARDRDRLAIALRRASSLPLGSGAVAGCPYPVDREWLARALGFSDVAENSMDAVGDRDFVAELLFVAAMAGTHLSRLAEDVIVFSTSEFAFLRLPDSHSTGSSLMPQKRNPDAMELARGKAGRLVGELTGWLATLKGLPSGYNKDLQEDKAALFTAFDALDLVLPAVAGTVAGLVIDREACAAAIDAEMLATDLADALVRAGVPFREAHASVGRLIRAAEDMGCGLRDVPSSAAVAVDAAFADFDLPTLLDPDRSLAARRSRGGTAPAAVREQLDRARALL